MSPFLPFPKIRTERLLLRRLEDRDAELLLALRSDPEVNRFIQREKPKNHDDIMAYMARMRQGIQDGKWVHWVITLNERDDLVGTICLWNFTANGSVAELGYEMRPQFQRRGIMQEALQWVLHYGFESLALYEIEAFTHKDNIASHTLLYKNQFVLQPDRRDADVEANRIFTLTEQAFRSK